MERPPSFQDLLESLRQGHPITIESGETFWRILFYENVDYFEQTPEGTKKISLEEAQRYLQLMVARWRRERRERRRKR